jgi:hypothetical protein
LTNSTSKKELTRIIAHLLSSENPKDVLMGGCPDAGKGVAVLLKKNLRYDF